MAEMPAVAPLAVVRVHATVPVCTPVRVRPCLAPRRVPRLRPAPPLDERQVAVDEEVVVDEHAASVGWGRARLGGTGRDARVTDLPPSTRWFTTVNVRVDDLFFGGSAARRAILTRFFSRPGVVRHVRELSRELGFSATIVGRELQRLERAGVLRSDQVGGTRRYEVDAGSPIAAEVRSLVQKTIGIEARLAQALRDVPGVEEAFLFGSYARGQERATSDLDLFVVGSVDQEVLSERLAEVERALGRDVNVVSYEPDELDRLRSEGDRFVTDVLAGPRIALIPSAGSA